jgi:single-stranded-DNA-specific exonuclease
MKIWIRRWHELKRKPGKHYGFFGDYDVDGTTAVSLVSSYLVYYPNTYIPDRYDEGYGISFKGIDFADDNGISLIIALDCGIKSLDHVAYAKERNIDFIICF